MNDRVNYVKLFRILVKLGLPPYIITVLINMCFTQQACVSWAGIVSAYFPVFNGVRHRRNCIIGQVNNTLCFFGKLTHAVKTRLFRTYCNSRYGFELWSLDDSSIAFGVTWRKAVRRILNTPPDTHNNLLPLLLGNTLPFFDDLCKRSSRFILECIQSESSLSRSVARFGIMAGLGNSFVVRNIVFLCSHFGWQFNEFVEGKK